jgi:hypothetical protein
MAFPVKSHAMPAPNRSRFGTGSGGEWFLRQRNQQVGRVKMGKGILLWLVGIPIPIIILLLLFWH